MTALAALLVMCACIAAQAEWKPAAGPLMTKWSEDVSPENAHPEYPRPQMVRPRWLSLNGLWDYAINPIGRTQPRKFDGQILVPFPIESALSGVMKEVGPDNQLWYHRTFNIPQQWGENIRILLHFGAVDWDTTVWVNGMKVGTHQGGYDPFTFDITHALRPTEPQKLVLLVQDPTDAGDQPRGKQVRRPHGIWYTPVTGIWQSVWIEPVSRRYIDGLKLTPDVDAAKLSVEIGTRLTRSDKVTVEVSADGKVIGRASGLDHIEVPIPNPHLWSPDDPFLYDVKITLRHFRLPVVTDEVQSYFAMRKISLEKDEDGINRLFLNGKPLFHYGPLDQGWWPDGLYTAPTDEALKYDIEVTKQLGMNMARKHVKVEPDRWYYWCDKLGLMVWQDMASGNNRTRVAQEQFEREWSRVVHAFYNHPSIVMWVPFNEGWGQHDTPRIVELTRKLDPTRLVNNASGWTDKQVGDVRDIHSYPGPAAPPVEAERAAVLGEFGGLGLPVRGHTWQDEKNWGYRSFPDRDKLTDAYLVLLNNLRSLIGGGLAAAVYTQTTDVEIEVNGLMTYDRAMIKMDTDKVRTASEKLYLPPPIVTMVVPTSQQQGQIWRYTTAKPADGWEKDDFDDSDWQIGKGGFGTEGTPGAIVGTTWNTSDIWLRRSFDLGGKTPSQLYLSVHHDEDAEIHLNGELIAKLTGYTSGYMRTPLDEKAKAALKPGLNRLAIHCHQTGGGQYIDVGFVDVKERPADN
jgi:hypothetical protein